MNHQIYKKNKKNIQKWLAAEIKKGGAVAVVEVNIF